MKETYSWRSWRKRRYLWPTAAGALADSAIFLFMAFGSLDHMLGQVIGKLYAVTVFAALAPLTRRVFTINP